jgi:sugar phosphate isomerase/epimerase
VNDRVLLSASPGNISDVLEVVSEYQLGIELMAFAMPDLLDTYWHEKVEEYQRLLAPVRGMITLHGPFFDMAPGSLDKRINALTMERYQHALRIAAELNASVVVFHANFIASLRNEEYRTGWTRRNIEFFRDIADYAAERGVMVAMENMWEFDPEILGDVLSAVDHPHLRACLDVGHAHLFSDVPFETWLATLEPWIIHTHLNNNDGLLDIHRAFPDGILDYGRLLPRLRALPNHPSMTLEMDNTGDMLASLPFFGIEIHETPTPVT